jgi:Na+/H+ antiporter NhaD/arsenite permease-like protein
VIAHLQFGGRLDAWTSGSIGAALASHSQGSAGLGAELGLWTLVPFLLILLAIALLPLFAPHFWEHNRNKALVGLALAAPIAIYLLLAHGDAGQHALVEKLREYVSFIVLLGALFVITGGIHVQGSLSGAPLVNTCVLALGAVLANVIGTTGASVLLIRPLLRANASRRKRVHLVVFFIFVVSNCGGLLTPLGDPPLFLGFLKGVPFAWTLGLWKQWLLVVGFALVVFHVWDLVVLDREERARPGSQLEELLRHEPLRVLGLGNALFLLGVVATIYASGRGWLTGGEPWPFGLQEAGMLGLAGAAYATTPRAFRERNRFTFGPIVEVAVLFAAIFVTMAPALLILNAWGHGQREVFGLHFRIEEPAQYFWASGGLSAFLDNAPTYLTFAATACGQHDVPIEGRYLEQFLQQGPQAARLLAAISCGAVFMGALTYIGNGPNFMVKAIAEENGVRMPSFFGYLACSALVLLPAFALVTWVFFR